MKKLLVYLKDYKKQCILAPLFKMLEATFELFVPLVMAAMIDKGIDKGDVPFIWKMGGLLLLLAVVGLTCSCTAQYFSAKAATGFSTKLRHALFAHIQSLSFKEMDQIGTSTLITRMTSDINQAQSGVNMTLRLFLRSPFIVFGAMVMAFTVDVKAAWIFVVTIPLLSLVVFGIMMLTIPLYRKVQAALDRVLGLTRENLTGVRVIRAFNREQEETQNYSQENEALTNLQKFVGKISGLTNPVTFIIVNVATLVLIYVGAVRVDRGILTTGMVVALVNYMSQILVELVKLANLIVTITKAIACGNRIQSVFELTSSLELEKLQKGDKNAENASMKHEAEAVSQGGQNDGSTIVEYKNVSLAYHEGGDNALSNISFTVKRGQTIGIIGGTGSGKSSLVNLIPRYYDATEGEVLVFGKNVKEYELPSLREQIGTVMQKSVLFQGTIRENIRWGKKDATDEEIWKALEISQSKEFVEAKEGMLDYEIEQGGRNLSGGQKQRLCIARAFVRKPQILILDDSSSALDFATDAALRKAIRENGSDMTVFMVSQRATSIMHADQIIVLEDGLIAGIGTHEELLETCEVYREINQSQNQEGSEVKKHE